MWLLSLLLDNRRCFQELVRRPTPERTERTQDEDIEIIEVRQRDEDVNVSRGSVRSEQGASGAKLGFVYKV